MFDSSCVSSAFSGPQLPFSLQRTKPSEGGGEGAAYTGPSSWQSGSASPVLGLRAPNLPISLAAVDRAQRDPAAVAAAAASSITQRMPGRALPAVPGASQPRTGPEGSGTHGSRQRSPRPQRTLAHPAPGTSGSGQRGIGAEETPAAATATAAAATATAAAARKQSPGGCCYPTPPTPSRCNALGPASARLLPGGAGLVRAAVCRCSSSPSPRCPPPSPRPAPAPSKRPSPAGVAALGAGDSGSDL